MQQIYYTVEKFLNKKKEEEGRGFFFLLDFGKRDNIQSSLLVKPSLLI